AARDPSPRERARVADGAELAVLGPAEVIAGGVAGETIPRPEEVARAGREAVELLADDGREPRHDRHAVPALALRDPHPHGGAGGLAVELHLADLDRAQVPDPHREPDRAGVGAPVARGDRLARE